MIASQGEKGRRALSLVRDYDRERGAPILCRAYKPNCSLSVAAWRRKQDVKVLTRISIVDELFEVVDAVREYRIDYDDQTASELALIGLYQLLSIVAGRVLGMVERRLDREV